MKRIVVPPLLLLAIALVMQPRMTALTGDGSGVLAAQLSPVSSSNQANTNARPRRAADPSCFDNVNRYVDCGNGTVTDTVTGLIWLKNANCLGYLGWAEANEAAAALSDGRCGLTDHSSPGDWVLPTLAEWKATIKRAEAMQCYAAYPFVALTNDQGTGCWGHGSSSLQPYDLYYWTSTTDEGAAPQTEPLPAWLTYIGNFEAPFSVSAKTYGAWNAWPIRHR